ncbi:MAG: hemerythrin family protein [Rhodospirillales bacterium]|nr:hemerythrin family protein [Rhodospirillales bacterium]
MTQQSPRIEWRPEFETGNAEIDHEHRSIVDRLNDVFVGAPSDETINQLGELYAWISAHFALEETIMRSHNYDQFQDHKDDHERLLDDIRDIMDDCQAGTFGGMDDALQQRLEDWFVGHFKIKDSRLHRMLHPDQ